MREKAGLLAEQLPGGHWSYDTVMAEGEVGFLEWPGEGENGALIEDAPTGPSTRSISSA